MGRFGRLALVLLVVLINFAILVFPSAAVSAAREGVSLWFDKALPSLLPFVVGVNLLMGLGAFEKAGEVAEGFARRFLRLPGVGVFAVIAGLTAGYPVGGKIAADLRADGALSRRQGLWLITFVNNAGPLFVVGTVGAAMFGEPAVGYLLLVSHYLGALCAALISRPVCGLLARRGADGIVAETAVSEGGAVAYEAGFGAALGKAVVSAMETMLMIGGFIVLFRVVTAILGITGLLPEDALLRALAVGLIEMTNGCAELSALFADSPRMAVAAAALVVSWGGLSVHAQTVALIAKTDLSAVVYVAAKGVQGVFAGVAAFALYPAFERLMGGAVAVARVGGFRQSLKGGIIALAFLLAVTLLLGIVRQVGRLARR